MPVAWSDNYGNGEGSAGLKPDNREHTFCFKANYDGDTPRDAARRSMDKLDDQTIMFDNHVPDCSENIDAKFHRAQLSGDGKWTCVDQSGDVCRSSRLDFDYGNIGGENDWRQTTCHEIGHSVGLAHGDGRDCMGTQHDDPEERRYHGHHVDHINNDSGV